MVIAGAGGFAKQLLEVFDQLDKLTEVVLFDNYSKPQKQTLYDVFPILHSFEEVAGKFASDNHFVIGVGGPKNRYLISQQFIALGGELQSIISPRASISKMQVKINTGVAILTNAIVESGVEIGQGTLVNIGAFITHDCKIGDYAEISPGVKISGGCTINSFCFLGTGSILIPKVEIGEGSIVAAGSVVTKNVPPNVLVAGAPATIKKYLNS